VCCRPVGSLAMVDSIVFSIPPEAAIPALKEDLRFSLSETTYELPSPSSMSPHAIALSDCVTMTIRLLSSRQQ
jgi:hypothetical protein